MGNDRTHPFFRPLWRRIAIVAFTVGWTAVEWANGDSTWGMITAGLCAYAVWAFLIDYPQVPAPDTPSKEPK